MSRKLAAIAVALAAAALAACAGRYGSGAAATGNSYVLPGMPDLKMTVSLPNGKTGSINEELPSEGLGTINDSFWSATLGGFTQQQFSQALGFPKGTKITLTNISKSIEHTLNVVQTISGPPANFPSNPTLPLGPSGKGKLKKGYASGGISPGKSVTLKLVKNGIYLIGCHFHYSEGMRDVLVVGPNATPGPQATAPGR
jgi:plastocyanin